jgi:hypothetical protein
MMKIKAEAALGKAPPSGWAWEPNLLFQNTRTDK